MQENARIYAKIRYGTDCKSAPAGFPSLRSARNTDPNHWHSHTWVEQDANERAFEFFYRRYRDDFRWHFNDNPILNEDWVREVQNRYGRSIPQPIFHPALIPTISNHFDWQFHGADNYWQHKKTPSDRFRNLLLLRR